MNRQSANYVESVGDNKHYDWQTPKHNRLWLLFTLASLGLVLWLFITQNTVHEEEVSISLQEIDSLNAPFASLEVNLSYDYSGDFTYSSDNILVYSKKTGKPSKDFLWAYAVFSLKGTDENHQYVKVTNDYNMRHKQGKRPEMVLVEKTLECDMVFNTVYRPVFNHTMYKITGKYTAQKPFEKKYILPQTLDDYSTYLSGDTIHTHTISQLYYKSLFGKKKHPVAFPRTTHVIDPQTGIETLKHTQEVQDMDYDEYMDYINQEAKNYRIVMPTITTEVVESFYALHATTSYINKTDTLYMYSGKSHMPLANKNVSCVRIQQGGLQLPNAEKTSFNIRYQSPMLFETLSIEPDIQTGTMISYTSPEKLKQINDEGLMIVARSIANANFQETLNFFYATLIGFIFSFIVEFTKRLYSYRRQKIYAAGWKYYPFYSIPKSIILSIRDCLKGIGKHQ